MGAAMGAMGGQGPDSSATGGGKGRVNVVLDDCSKSAVVASAVLAVDAVAGDRCC